MTLVEFLKMWQEDGTQLIEQDRRVLNGSLWLLYCVYFPESTYEYGRHSALILKVDNKTDEILMHDVDNITGEATPEIRPTVYRSGRTLDDWFEAHAGKY